MLDVDARRVDHVRTQAPRGLIQVVLSDAGRQPVARGDDWIEFDVTQPSRPGRSILDGLRENIRPIKCAHGALELAELAGELAFIENLRLGKAEQTRTIVHRLRSRVIGYKCEIAGILPPRRDLQAVI